MSSSKLSKLIIQKIGFDPDNEEHCLNAVKQNGYNIRYIKNPSEEVQLEAVKDHAIYFIKNPSEEVQLEAIKENGSNIYFIKNPSEEIQLAAVKQSPDSIQYINNPSIEVQKAAIHSSGCNLVVIAMCPNWKEFEKEILDNMMIKDIIE
jgi:hypothetical protein